MTGLWEAEMPVAYGGGAVHRITLDPAEVVAVQQTGTAGRALLHLRGMAGSIEVIGSYAFWVEKWTLFRERS